MSVVMGKGPSRDLHASRGGDISGGGKLLGRQECMDGKPFSPPAFPGLKGKGQSVVA